MLSVRKNILLALGLVSVSLLTGCNDGAGQAAVSSQAAASQVVVPTVRLVLDVYKSPSCGCCGEWMKHLDSQGIGSVTHDLAELEASHARAVVPAQYRSCHTGVSSEGYVFEGHVPARYVKQFLNELPEGGVGLSVPGMPLGSPGMEQGDKFTPYKVFLLMNDGSSRVFAAVNTPAEQ